MPRIKKVTPVRSFSIEMWTTNKTNKKYLAIDFHNRCAYCDDSDNYNGGYNNYHVEHFAPKEKFPELEFVYGNLLYACPFCNISKSNKWVSDSKDINVIINKGFLDPCDEEYYVHLYRNDDGSIGYNSDLGKYIFEELRLYLKRHQILYRITTINEKIIDLERIIENKKRKSEDTCSLEELLFEMLKEFRNSINSLN